MDLNEDGPPEEAPSPPEPFLVCLKADDIDGRLVLVGDGEDSYEFKIVIGQSEIILFIENNLLEINCFIGFSTYLII